MSKKQYPIWDYFTVAEDTTVALCKVCFETISRGGKCTKTFNTSNMVYHLKVKHSSEYADYKKKDDSLKAVKASSSSCSKPVQHSLRSVVANTRQWDINDPKASAIHRRLVEMIAVDCQPFSIVDDAGFQRLIHSLEPRYKIPSRKYIAEKITPTVYEEIRESVATAISNAMNFSFTTDIWSTIISSHSLISLTCHWITDEFERKFALLQAQEFDESHTGQHIAEVLLSMLSSWNIDKSKVHLFIRDNASNMVKAMSDATLPSFGCFAHSLQLVVNDGVLSQGAVTELLSTSRKIVGHFRRSCLAKNRLKEIQSNLGLPLHQLIQDEPTRWNSALYMLKAQKMAIGAYAMEYDIPQLSAHQLELANKIIKGLLQLRR